MRVGTDLVIDEPVFAYRERVFRFVAGTCFVSSVRKRLDSRAIGGSGLGSHRRSAANAKGVII